MIRECGSATLSLFSDMTLLEHVNIAETEHSRSGLHRVTESLYLLLSFHAMSIWSMSSSLLTEQELLKK